MNVQQLIQLLQQDQKTHIDHHQLITGVTDDSRQVEEGNVFVAVKGYHADGHEFIQEAISKGASVIVSEEAGDYEGVVFLQTENTRRALGQIASAFYGHPSADKIVIGVTGTNGKTTTTHMIKHLCEENGWSCGLLGTIDYSVNGTAVPGTQTTPGAPMLQKLLSESSDKVIVMEVSSHGLDQYRLEGVTFDYAVFTNLYKDHLDYHDSMESYFQAKAKLFHMLKPGGEAIVNTDDAWGEKLSCLLKEKSIPVTNIGKHKRNDGEIQDIDTRNFTGSLYYEGEAWNISSPLQGTHNVYNTMQAFLVGRKIGLTFSNMIDSIQNLSGIRGRFERLAIPNGPQVVIDYAHTADSIGHVLDTARQQGAVSLTHVFGFRGDRDESKRAEMLAASARRTDAYILTLDDLNSVPYETMVDDLGTLQESYGARSGTIIPDRTLAITEAIERSGPGDWVVITGKGHESYQQTYHHPFDSDKDLVQHVQQKKEEVMKTDILA